MDYFSHFWDSHWFTAIGLITALLGILYTSGNYLYKKFASLKVMTFAFTFGILGAIISFLNFFLFTLVEGDFRHYDSIALPYGFASGLSVFFILYILLMRLKPNKLLLFTIICVSLLINIFEINMYNFFQYAIYLSYILAYISSFILGVFIASLRISPWKKTSFGFLIICLILAMLVFLNVLQIRGLDNQLNIYIVGFVVGNITYKANQDRIDSKEKNFLWNAWIRFIFWLSIACLAQLIIILPNFYYNKELALLFYALCASNAQGDKIIKQIKLRVKVVANTNILIPRINWKRFINSLLIVSLYILPLSLQGYLLISKFHGYTLYMRDTLGLIFYLQILFVTSLIYGFGNVIVYNIENLSNDRLTIIGIILSIIGILIAALNH